MSGHPESAEYAFHIETGRFVEVGLPPLFSVMFDGLDGRIVTTTTPAHAWAIDPGEAGSPGVMRALHDDGSFFPAFPPSGYATQASAFRDGSIPVYMGTDSSLPPPDNGRTWALVRQDPTDHVFRIERRVQRNESTGNIVTTADDTVLYYQRSRRRGSWENQNHEVTLFRMDANLENEEALLTERWYFPVEIALGDPVERVVAARDE